MVTEPRPSHGLSNIIGARLDHATTAATSYAHGNHRHSDSSQAAEGLDELRLLCLHDSALYIIVNGPGSLDCGARDEGEALDERLGWRCPEPCARSRMKQPPSRWRGAVAASQRYLIKALFWSAVIMVAVVWIMVMIMLMVLRRVVIGQSRDRGQQSWSLAAERSDGRCCWIWGDLSQLGRVHAGAPHFQFRISGRSCPCLSI